MDFLYPSPSLCQTAEPARCDRSLSFPAAPRLYGTGGEEDKGKGNAMHTQQVGLIFEGTRQQGELRFLIQACGEAGPATIPRRCCVYSRLMWTSIARNDQGKADIEKRCNIQGERRGVEASVI